MFVPRRVAGTLRVGGHPSDPEDPGAATMCSVGSRSNEWLTRLTTCVALAASATEGDRAGHRAKARLIASGSRWIAH